MSNGKVSDENRNIKMQDATGSTIISGDRNSEGSALNNLGIAYISLGKYQQAIEFHQQSLNIAREMIALAKDAPWMV